MNYVSLAAAQSQNLVATVNGQFKMSVSTGALVGNNRVSGGTLEEMLVSLKSCIELRPYQLTADLE